MMVASVSQAALWTNNPTAGNMLFSDSRNWTNGVLPISNEVMNGIKGTTTALNPALVDSAFNIGGTNGAFGTFNLNSGKAGTAYLAVQSGATLRSSNLYMGNVNQSGWNGDLTLKTGGSIVGSAGGTLFVGTTASSTGKLTLENGASLSFSILNLATNGTMKFIFGTNSVTTFNANKLIAGSTNLLNGLIQVDLDALTASGTYTLLDSKTNIMTGTMYNWLDGLGGSVSNNGNFTSANFEVLNGGTKKWTLALADNKKDLVLTVIPEPTTISLFVVAGIGAFVMRRIAR
jgi:hypothetical protein